MSRGASSRNCSVSDSVRAARCSSVATPAQPLGAPTVSLFPAGGFGAIRLPLLAALDEGGQPHAAPCFGSGSQLRCVTASQPSLFDNVPYAYLALNARPNSFAHSEVDFGSIIWSCWGQRLISDFGYGTIATAVGEWDMRRYEQIDNNPAGHSTLVVREAFAADSETINFSQMNKGGTEGTLAAASAYLDDGMAGCVELDGSTVYGSTRPGGWLDVMRRYACPLDEDAPLPGYAPSGSILVVDVMGVKPGREPLSMYGSQYTGPDFHEPSPASAALHLDEYFYSDTCATLETDAEGGSVRETAWDRAQLGGAAKWCRHVEVSDEGYHDAMHVLSLSPGTGIGSYREPDGFGAIGGHAQRGGAFVYDGLITAPDRWGRAHRLKKRRIRFVGSGTIDASGDVRTFLLAPSLNRSALPPISMRSCSQELGCGEAEAPIACSCVSVCVGTRLRWAVVVGSRLSLLRTVGTCAAQPTTTPSPAETTVEALETALVDRARVLAKLEERPPSPPVPPLPPPAIPPTLTEQTSCSSNVQPGWECVCCLERGCRHTPFASLCELHRCCHPAGTAPKTPCCA